MRIKINAMIFIIIIIEFYFCLQVDNCENNYFSLYYLNFEYGCIIKRVSSKQWFLSVTTIYQSAIPRNLLLGIIKYIFKECLMYRKLYIYTKKKKKNYLIIIGGQNKNFVFSIHLLRQMHFSCTAILYDNNN